MKRLIHQTTEEILDALKTLLETDAKSIARLSDSVTDLSEKLDYAEKVRSYASTYANRIRYEADNVRKTLVMGALSERIKDPNDYFAFALTEDKLKIGSWECEDSPIGICAYNSKKDYINDFCLFCGGPDERK